MARFPAYIPVSALTDAERARYHAELREKGRRYPHLFRGEAAAAGIRARIVSERTREEVQRDQDFDW